MDWQNQSRKNKVEIVYSSGSGREYLKNLDIRLDDEKMSSCQTVQCFRAENSK